MDQILDLGLNKIKFATTTTDSMSPTKVWQIVTECNLYKAGSSLSSLFQAFFRSWGVVKGCEQIKQSGSREGGSSLHHLNAWNTASH